MTALMQETPFTPDQPVRAIQIPDVSCPRCGGELHYVNDRPPGATGYSSMVLLHCPRKGCPTWELRVEWITCGQPPSTPRTLEEAYP